jgi:hypothetical protein
MGFRLLTKFGEKGAINMGKAVPLLGGLIGLTFGSVATNTIGNTARDTFIENTKKPNKSIYFTHTDPHLLYISIALYFAQKATAQCGQLNSNVILINNQPNSFKGSIEELNFLLNS